MNVNRAAAVLLIVAAIAILASSAVNAPGLYQTQDIDERMEIIQTYRTRWLATQAMVAAFGLLLVVGFVLLALNLRAAGGNWLPMLGGVAITVGTISALYFIYLQTIDPRGGYSGQYPRPEELTYWLWLAGQLLFGIAILQADLPSWLGYLTAGAALAYAIVFFVTGAGFMTPFLLAIISVVIGIVLLRT